MIQILMEGAEITVGEHAATGEAVVLATDEQSGLQVAVPMSPESARKVGAALVKLGIKP